MANIQWSMVKYFQLFGTLWQSVSHVVYMENGDSVIVTLAYII